MSTISPLRSWDGTAVLVADPTDGSIPTSEFDRRIDRPLASTVDMIANGLAAYAKQVVRYSNLGEFTAALEHHRNSIVFPYWFGQDSRSRHGLVPAICEAGGVMFVGADAYAKVVCNDKELSKVICRQAGLEVPGSAVLTSLQDIQYADYLSLPVVVKPNYEGTSLGITQKNLCRSWDEVRQVAKELFDHFKQPVIVEEFIVGREFSACMIGNKAKGVTMEIGGWEINGDANFLNHRLNTFDLKLPSDYRFVFEDLNSLFLPGILNAFLDCFDRLGKTELLRIDGRLTEDGRPIILELTPDIYLGADGEMCSAFGYNEQTFNEFISRIVTNSIEGYQAGMPVR